MSATVFIKDDAQPATSTSFDGFSNIARCLSLLEVWKFLKDKGVDDYSVRYTQDGVYIDFENENDAFITGLRFGTRS